ncbi:MAG: ScbR family autoregulator-binding transcription factor [Sciscionella sp.]
MPQQDRAHATRRMILSVAAEEFQRVGYFGTSIGTVLQRSGITKGAFYFHFPSKEALVEELVSAQDEIGHRVARQWMERGLDPLRTLMGMVDEMARRTASDTVVAAGVRLSAERGLLVPGATTPYQTWERAFERLLTESQRLGLVRPEVDVRSGARLLNQAIIGARVMSLVTDQADYPMRVRGIWAFALPLVATPEWLSDWMAEQWETTDQRG